MIGIRRMLQDDQGQPEVNMAPLIDMVFILLIFFLVTTTFIQDAGLEVERPQSSTAVALERDQIRIAIGAGGEVHMNGREIGLYSVRALVRDRLRQKDSAVLILSHKAARTQRLIEVMDECRKAGAKKIQIGADAQ